MNWYVTVLSCMREPTAAPTHALSTNTDAGLHAGRHWSKNDLCKTVQQHVSQWDACVRLETDRLFHPLICFSCESLMWGKKCKAAKSLIAIFPNSKKRRDFSHKITFTECNFLLKQNFTSSQRTAFSLSVATKARACGRWLCHAPLGELLCCCCC